MKLPEDIKNRIFQIWNNPSIVDGVPSIQKFVHEIFEKSLMEYTLNHKMEEDAQYHVLIEVARGYSKADPDRTEAIEEELCELFHTSIDQLSHAPIQVWGNRDELYRCFWSEEKLPFDTEYLHYNQGISKRLMGNYILIAHFWKTTNENLFDEESKDLITVSFGANSSGYHVDVVFNHNL